MKFFSRITLVLTAVLPMSAMADELPNSAFKELINIHETHYHNASQENKDSYYLLYGFALKNDDLVNTGRAYFASELEHNKNQLTYEEIINQRQKLGFEKLDLSQPDNQANIFCKLTQADCIKVLFDNKQDWQPTIEKYNILLNRYQEFLNRKPAITEHLLTPSSPIPDYLPLIQAQRLTHLTYLNADNKNAKIVKEMEKEREILRNQLKLADSLIQKLIIYRMLNENLQTTILLKTRFGLNFNTPINQLTIDEKSLRLPLAYEFVSQEKFFQKELTEFSDYQHDTTFNGVAKYFLNQIEWSEKSAIEIGNYQINFKEKKVPIKISKKGNKRGFVFANTAVINFVGYAQRINELDNVINMTNFILSNDNKYLINVFTNNNQNIVKDNEKICMPIPKSRYEMTQTCMFL